MRKIVHYIKEYEPKVKLLCGCRDGFIRQQGEEITCKRCIKSLKARGQPLKKPREYSNPTQSDMFKPLSKLEWFKIKFHIWVREAKAWFKSNFRAKDKTPVMEGVILSVSIGHKKYSWPDLKLINEDPIHHEEGLGAAWNDPRDLKPGEMMVPTNWKFKGIPQKLVVKSENLTDDFHHGRDPMPNVAGAFIQVMENKMRHELLYGETEKWNESDLPNFDKEIELIGRAGKMAGERNVKTVMDIINSESQSDDGSHARP